MRERADRLPDRTLSSETLATSADEPAPLVITGKMACTQGELRCGMRPRVANACRAVYNQGGGAGVRERGGAVSGVIELVAIECCGERYLLVEELRSSLVARWFVRDGCESGQPVTACLGCRGPFEAPQPRESARVLWGTGAPRSPT
jgi:hypothetical protein